MSWWDIGDDITGDTPADIIRAALKNHAERCTEQNMPKPGLLTVLNATVLAIAQSTEKLEDIADFNSNDIVIKATLNTNDECLTSTHHQQPATTEEVNLAGDMVNAIKEIEKAYLNSWQRKPRVREILYALEFILGYKPSRFIDSSDDLEIEKITT